MGNMIAYVEVTWNEKENNNNFGYRFEVPIPLTFTTESEAAKKKFAFFIRKDGIEICDEKFATVGFCPCSSVQKSKNGIFVIRDEEYYEQVGFHVV